MGEVTSLELTLQIAPEQTRVSVGAGGVVDQTKTEVSQVVRQSQILNLPINGRRVDTYVLLTPAVVPDGALGLVSFRGMAGGNSFLTDGNDTTNQFFDENAGRTRISTQISQDAVLEFQVLSSGYSAAYGRAAGGIINTVTRSGANTPYGTAYWFFRNRGLNAQGSVRRHQSRGAPPSGRREPGRKIRTGQAVLLFQRRGSPARLSAGGLARPSAALRQYGKVHRHLRGQRSAVRGRAPIPEPPIPGSGPEGRFGAGLRQAGLAALAEPPRQRQFQLPALAFAERISDAGRGERRLRCRRQRQLFGADAIWPARVDVHSGRGANQ